MARTSWDEHWLNVAFLYATRATCPRLHVGAVIVAQNYQISAGYNGALPGEPHCDEVGCLMHAEHCLRAIHAERNALARVDRRDVVGATLYCTHEPCLECLKHALTAGIRRVVFAEQYPSEARAKFLTDLLRKRRGDTVRDKEWQVIGQAWVFNNA